MTDPPQLSPRPCGRMLRRRVRRRGLRLAVAPVAAALLLGGCQLGSSSGGASGGNAAPSAGAGSTWCGTITMFAQEYTPNAKTANTLNLKELQKAADAYKQKYSCRSVSFVDDKFQDNITTIRTKAAAGELFDVFWAQWTSFQGQLPAGVASNLSPAFNAPSPYAPQAKTWAESMNPQIIADTRTGSGASYNVNGDWVANGWYYNKDLFTKAGITAAPKTWTEFVDACQKLKAAGINPASFVPYYGWMARPFLSTIYANQYQQLAALDGAPGFSTADEALAQSKGLLTATDPKFTSWWAAFKKASDTWNPDYVTADPDKNFQAEQDFLAGRSAMYFNGSYFTSKLKSANLPFAFDVFPFPKVDPQTSADTTDVDPGDTIGGPTGAFQFAMATGQSDKSMGEAGKPEAVLDWLQFVTAPKTAEAIVNETGEFLPTFAGTTPRPEFANVAAAITQPTRTIRVGYTAPNLDQDDQRIFGSYLGGQLSLEQARGQLGDAMSKAADAYIKQNNLKTG